MGVAEQHRLALSVCEEWILLSAVRHQVASFFKPAVDLALRGQPVKHYAVPLCLHHRSVHRGTAGGIDVEKMAHHHVGPPFTRKHMSHALVLLLVAVHRGALPEADHPAKLLPRFGENDHRGGAAPVGAENDAPAAGPDP